MPGITWDFSPIAHPCAEAIDHVSTSQTYHVTYIIVRNKILILILIDPKFNILNIYIKSYAQFKE